jgi:hypothetical protein
MFYQPVNEDLLGLPCNGDYLIYRWDRPDCRVYFSVAQKGYAMTAHFSSDKAGLRRLKTAIPLFCNYIFKHFNWCQMIFAIIGPRSIARLCEQCNFEHLLTNDRATVMVRYR